MRRPARIRYDGPVYGSQPGVLCLYCIQSGEAARRLGVPAVGPAMFSDAVDVPDDVPAAVVDEVVQRTPGFHAWREGHWLYHCGDAHRCVPEHPGNLREQLIERLRPRGMPILGLHPRVIHDRQHAQPWPPAGLRSRSHADNGTLL